MARRKPPGSGIREYPPAAANRQLKAIPNATDEQRDKAAQYIRRHAKDEADANYLLNALGLVDGEREEDQKEEGDGTS